MKITLVSGARPNFMKISPIVKALDIAILEGYNIKYRIIHTGQHYDHNMSSNFFAQLGIPMPDNNLKCSSGSQAEQTAKIMIEFEKELIQNFPDIVVVVGDVNSTMACAITSKKLGIKTVHVEAGIRSGDMAMPEEINRVVTDAICDDFFTTSEFANLNLKNLQIPSNKIHFVGNTMIDTLVQNFNKMKAPEFWDAFELKKNNYFILTLHRPINVDNPVYLESLLKNISLITNGYKIIFPIHPRTKSIIDSFLIPVNNILLVEPQSYNEFIFLITYSKAVITDSGGISEETTVLNIPCITLRDTTERPETVLNGSNVLVGNNMDLLNSNIQLILNNQWKNATLPMLWDGHAAERIVNTLILKYYPN